MMRTTHFDMSKTKITMACLLMAASLSGCQTLEKALTSSTFRPAAVGTAESKSVERSLRAVIADEKINTAARKLAAEGIDLLDKGEYEQASKLFNQALKLDMGNSYLHFLNGHAYHYRAIKEESQLFALAIEGYERAVKFDRSNWFANYYLGQVYIDQRKFGDAKLAFEAAAIYAPKDPEVLYGLSAAAYYSHDLRTAEAALGQLRTLKAGMDPELNRAVLHSSAIVNAGLGKADQAQLHLAALTSVSTDQIELTKIADRIDGWQRVRQLVEQDQLAQFPTPDPTQPVGNAPAFQVPNIIMEIPAGPGAQAPNAVAVPEVPAFPAAPAQAFPAAPGQAIPAGIPAAPAAAGGNFVNSQMAVVDVTIVRTEEDISTAKGVNLLSGLQLQFGNQLTGAAAFGIGRNTVFDRTGTGNDAVDTKTITSLISIPGVTYSLNIANSRTDRNEVLARPTLVARSGQTSEFFSGVEVSAAATSGGAGDSVSIQKEVGVKLSVTPEFLPNNEVLLQVQAERTFLTQPSRSVVFEFRLDTSKTTVNANVAMKFGQTLILSGLSERETENSRDGVPFLEDVPGLQYFFSRSTTRNFRKSVLILLTPRRTQYLHENEADREERLKNLPKSEQERSKFERRFADWFEPLPHTAHVFEHFKSNLLYQDEFRTGDFPLIKWNSLETHDDRIKAAQKFLYY